MREQVDRLGKLATDLLELSKLDAGALELRETPVDLGHLSRQIADEFAPVATREGAAVEVIDPERPIARGDPDRIGQILRILIDNALTHTPEGTPIKVITQISQGGTAVVVQDEGPGIEPWAASRVFDRFYTGDSVGGTGLGLAIARELASRMRGSLVLAEGRRGTAFRLTLPAAAKTGSGASA
jgi:signal transduction histidine kinase